ncbi:MAG: hypothetical protein H6925_04130 [Holosporaceae bacterium]|nr:MAG: hypothetical protein H6925_04130 [Holosporaceae bacterium]
MAPPLSLKSWGQNNAAHYGCCSDGAGKQCLAHLTQETLRQLNLFSEAFRYIRSKSARPVSDEVLIANAIEGMLAGIDGHSTYVTAEKYQELLGSLRGSFGGIGIEFTMKDGRPVVVSPPLTKPCIRSRH